MFKDVSLTKDIGQLSYYLILTEFPLKLKFHVFQSEKKSRRKEIVGTPIKFSQIGEDVPVVLIKREGLLK